MYSKSNPPLSWCFHGCRAANPYNSRETILVCTYQEFLPSIEGKQQPLCVKNGLPQSQKHLRNEILGSL